MGRKISALVVGVALALPVLLFAQTAAGPPVSPKELLEQYMDDLQTNPRDAQLRRRIIKVVATMDPKPQVPEKVTELQGEAEAALGGAKTQSDFHDAVEAFSKASLLAPWAPGIYFDLAQADEAAQLWTNAVSNYRLYLYAKPGAPDRQKVELRIGYDKEQLKMASEAAKATSQTSAPTTPQPVEEQPQSPAPGTQSTMAESEGQNAGSTGWTLSRLSRVSVGEKYLAGNMAALTFGAPFPVNARPGLFVTISNGVGGAASVDYTVNDPSPVSMAQEWSTGDTMSLGTPDFNHTCPSTTDDSILTDETRNQWVCAEYMAGGSGTISRIVSEDPGCLGGTGIYLTDMAPPNANAQYCLFGGASRTARDSWRMGDRVSISTTPCGKKDDGKLFYNERTGEPVCDQGM